MGWLRALFCGVTRAGSKTSGQSGQEGFFLFPRDGKLGLVVQRNGAAIAVLLRQVIEPAVFADMVKVDEVTAMDPAKIMSAEKMLELL